MTPYEPPSLTLPTDVLRAYRLLSDVNHALLRTTEEAALLDAVCRLVVETGGHRFAWVGVPARDTERHVTPVACYGAGGEYLRNTRISWADAKYGQGPTGTAARTGQTVIAQDLGNSDYFWRDRALQHGFHAMIALPLKQDGAVFAVLVIYADTTQRFDATEATLLGELAENLAFGITALRAREERRQARALLETNERRFRALIEHSTDVFCLLNARGEVDYLSPSVETVLGYPPEALLGRYALGILHDTDVPRIRAELAALQRTPNGTVTLYCCVQHRDGSWRRLEVVGHNRMRDPSVARTVIIFRDITEFVRNEERLRESEEQYRVLFESSADAIYLHEMHPDGLPGRFLAVNDAACRHFGYPREELLTLQVLDVVAPDKQGLAPVIGQRLLDMREATWESRHRAKDGREIPVEIHNTVFELHGRRMVLANARNISERQRTLAQLEDALNFTNTMLEASPVGMIVFDAAGPCLSLNEAAVQIVGGAREAILQQNFRTLPSWTESGMLERADCALRERRGIDYEAVLTTTFEKTSLLSIRFVPFTFAGQQHLLLILHDITARREAETALTAERERLRVTLRSIGEGVIATDVAGRVALVNRVGERLTGWTQEEIVGQTLPEVIHLLHPETREPFPDPVACVLKREAPLDGGAETLLTARDGSERLITCSGAPIRDRDGQIHGAVLVFRDESGAHLLRQEIQRMAKLDSLATMAGGIAHDFNNLLTAISGNIGLAELMLQAQPPEAVQRYLRDAEQATMRARDLTQQLLTFARGGAPLRETITLAPVVHEATALAMTGSQSRCSVAIPPDVWPIHADAGQIHQVLHNLLLNADQAMPGGGTISVSAENVTLAMGAPSPLPAGDYVRLCVRDQGVGIPAGLQGKIFDPFFTTKQRGSGLGLASVYSIVRSHEGHVGVESTPGVGSLFSVLLPARPVAPAVPVVRATAAETPAAYHILLLDDDAMILHVLSDLLRVAGHTVIAVADGAAAVAAWRAARGEDAPFDLAILDLTIPGGFGGAEVVAQLRRDDPGLIAIASSGYTTGAVMAEYTQYGFAGRLAKPYRLRDIQQTIRQVMGGGGEF